MAIQVAGQPVITDTRALNNITSIDSTTASAISAQLGGGLSFPTSATVSLVKSTSGTNTSISAGLYLCEHIVGYSDSFVLSLSGNSSQVFAQLTGNDLSSFSYYTGSSISITGGAYSKTYGWFYCTSTTTGNLSGSNSYTNYVFRMYKVQ